MPGVRSLLANPALFEFLAFESFRTAGGDRIVEIPARSCDRRSLGGATRYLTQAKAFTHMTTVDHHCGDDDYRASNKITIGVVWNPNPRAIYKSYADHCD